MVTIVGLALLLSGLAPQSAAGVEPTNTLSITPTADTYVRMDRPSSSYGSQASLRVDGEPVMQSFLRFAVRGTEGSTVDRVRLRLYQVDSSRVGGRVFSVASTDWSENITWSSRPSLSGTQLAGFGSVKSGVWYEVDLPPSVIVGDGSYSFAMDSVDSDGVAWGSRESTHAPVLLLDFSSAPEKGDPPPEPIPPMTTVAGSSVGSSDPTYYGNSHRLEQSAGGRLLTVHGRHASGVQLAWRDRGTRVWSTATTGAVEDGALLSGTGTGDWPASIAVVREEDGQETAFGRVGRAELRGCSPAADACAA